MLTGWGRRRRPAQGWCPPPPLIDRVEPAEVHALPSTQWISLGDRLRSRSRRVLRAEALYAVAAMTLGALGRRFESCRPD